MTIAQMLYFNTVCQYMDLTMAAQQLKISPSELSIVLEQICAECGTELFRHRCNAIDLTDEGAVLRQEIEGTLKHYRQLKEKIQGGHLERNYVRVGFPPVCGLNIASEIAALFKRRHPNTALQLTEEGNDALFKALDEDQLDVIIASPDWESAEEATGIPPVYEILPIWNDQLLFAVSIHHPLAQQESVSWEDIMRIPLILLSPNDELTQHIEERLRQSGFQPPAQLCFISQLYTALTLIETNFAAGFLPAKAIHHHPRIKELLYPRAERQLFYLIFRKDRHLFQAVSKFVDTARELFDKDERKSKLF